MKNELVSIIIPVYNSSLTLKKCLDSITNQTYNEIEIIVINDGSNDESEKIIMNYNDKRIKYYYIDNHGVSYARNLGINKSHGAYICFVDSDDYIDKNMIEKLLVSMNKYKVDIIRFSGYIETSQKKFNPIEFPISNHYICSNKSELLEMIMRNENSIRCYTPLLFMKNSEIVLFDDKLKYLEDKLFYIQNLLNNKKILFLDEDYYYYTNNFNSKTKKFDNYYNNLLDLLDSFEPINKAVRFYNYPTEKTAMSYLVLLLYRIEFFIGFNNYKSTNNLLKSLYNNKKFIRFLNLKAFDISFFHKFEIFLLRKKMIFAFYIIIKIKKIMKELIK